MEDTNANDNTLWIVIGVVGAVVLIIVIVIVVACVRIYRSKASRVPKAASPAPANGHINPVMVDE